MKLIDSVNTVRHGLGYGLSVTEIAGHLIEKGLSSADAYFAIAATRILDSQPVTVPDTGNRAEQCTQTVSR